MIFLISTLRVAGIRGMKHCSGSYAILYKGLESLTILESVGVSGILQLPKDNYNFFKLY
jgi:hypothetical protein